MQQALHLLQMPVMELASLINEEMSQNPLLEWEEEDELPMPLDFQGDMRSQSTAREEDDLKNFIENTVAYETSLFDHLMQQTEETFSLLEEKELAEWIIGTLDSSGFLTSSIEEISILANSTVEKIEEILEVIQTFDPPGVGARSLKESLLIQLSQQGKSKTLAYRIVEQGYDDMLHNRIPSISKALHRSAKEVYETIAHEIAPLDFHPGAHQPAGHYRSLSQQVTPDLLIHYDEEKLTIEINDSSLPSVKLNKSYLSMLNQGDLNEEAKSYIQEKLSSGKWLLRNLQERHQTLRRIAAKLIEIQGNYFYDPDAKLKPLTMKEIAETLELHESTIARAVANKYVSCPRGTFPLRAFFTNAYTTQSGEAISANTVKDCLVKIIEGEDRSSPLSDETISGMIRQKGVECARRTVAKYRQELGIGNTTQRRIHI